MNEDKARNDARPLEARHAVLIVQHAQLERALATAQAERDTARAEVAQARAERDNAITNHALLSDDYRNLQQDLRLTRGVLEAAQHRLVAHGCSGKHDMDDCPMCAAKATIATLRAELQAAQAEHRVTLCAFAERSRIAEESERYLANELAAARAEVTRLYDELGRVSEELGLPRSIGPAPGWLKQQMSDAKQTREQLQAAQALLADALDGIEYFDPRLYARMKVWLREQAHPTPAQEGR